MKHGRVLLVALAAGTLGLVASLLATGPGPLWRTEAGQRLLGAAIDATAPEPPPGVAVARRGDAIPVLDLQDLDGRPATFPGEHAGRLLLVNLWAS